MGIGKREYLTEELGEGTVKFMRTIKKAVDPMGLFNPGKVSEFLGYLLNLPHDKPYYIVFSYIQMYRRS